MSVITFLKNPIGAYKLAYKEGATLDTKGTAISENLVKEMTDTGYCRKATAEEIKAAGIKVAKAPAKKAEK